MPYAVVLSSIPARLTVGESVSWKWSDGNFPATVWTLVYTLASPHKQIQITATADGSAHLIEIPAATSADYLAGQYDYQAHVDNGSGERYQVDAGVIEIDVDLATESNGIDQRSHVKKVLDALEASIEGRATKTQLEQKVGGVEIKHISLAEQIISRDRYAFKYKKEQAAKGQGRTRRTIKSRFAN